MINQLAKKWIKAKADEAAAVAFRRNMEDEMAIILGLSAGLEGIQIFDVGEYQIKTVSRNNTKIDTEKLQEIAAENGLTEHLSMLFRWKPETNMKVWAGTSTSITTPLLEAFTVTPGRPTFSVTVKVK